MRSLYAHRGYRGTGFGEFAQNVAHVGEVPYGLCRSDIPKNALLTGVFMGN